MNAGASEDVAQRQARWRWWLGRSWQHLPGQPGGVPLGGVFGQRKASRQTVAQRAPVRGRHVDGGDTQRLDAVDALQHGAHVGIAFGVQQQARARLHAGDALCRVQRRASLHHHELPADRAVVVGLPADAAEHRARQEHRAAPPVVQAQRARRFAEAQVEFEAMFEVGQRNAGQRHVAGLTGEYRGMQRRCSRGRASGGRSGCGHGVFSLRCSGNSRSSRLRSRSATVTPCVKADTLMRARMAGVMSSVRRAV